jgi:choline-sulfatase
VPASQQLLQVAGRPFRALPEMIEERYFCSDSAYDEESLLTLLRDEKREDEPQGSIGLAVSADMNQALHAKLVATPEAKWQFYGEDDAAIKERAEIAYTPEEGAENRYREPLCYVAIRIRKRHAELFPDSSQVKRFAVISNLWNCPVKKLLEWHREKAGSIEAAHDVIKNELAGGVMPCGRFGANAVWLRLAVLTYYLLTVLKRLALPPELLAERPKACAFCSSARRANRCIMCGAHCSGWRGDGGSFPTGITPCACCPCRRAAERNEEKKNCLGRKKLGQSVSHGLPEKQEPRTCRFAHAFSPAALSSTLVCPLQNQDCARLNTLRTDYGKCVSVCRQPIELQSPASIQIVFTDRRGVTMNRRSFVGRCGAALLAWGLKAMPQKEEVSTFSINTVKRSRPNVVLLMADQWRADCMGAYGNTHIRTPNLDRIAQEGVRFTSAYSATPTCMPARCALLTGMGPWRNGLLGYAHMATQPYPVEKAKAMAQAGYYTTSIGKNHYYPMRNAHGYHQLVCDEHCSYWFNKQDPQSEASWEERCDYEAWFWSRMPDKDPHGTGLGWNDHRGKPFVYPEEMHATHWTGETTINFLKSYERAEPFFLKVSFIRPHSPYDAPERFFNMYEGSALPEPQVGNWAKRYEQRSGPGNDLWHGKLPAEEVRRSRQGYYGAASFVDEQIGRIMEVLEKRKLLDETLILFISDHGDMLGDQNLWRKSYGYEQSTHIPMLMRLPSGMGLDAAGQVMDNPVELRDILPTLLDAVGAPVPNSLEGRSLLELVRSRGRGWREYIDLEHNITFSPAIHWNGLTNGKWKYIYHALNGEEQLFHIEQDPYELKDLAGLVQYEAQLKLWRERLVAHLDERGPAWVRNGKLVPRPEGMMLSPNFPGYAPAEATLKRVAYGA